MSLREKELEDLIVELNEPESIGRALPIFKAAETIKHLRDTLRNIALLACTPREALNSDEAIVWMRTLAATEVGITLTGREPLAIAPHITKAAVDLVLEILPGNCPAYRQEQLCLAALVAVGMPTKGPDAMRCALELRSSIKHRGKHEYEVEAVEDVLIKWHRMRHHS